MDYQFTKSHEWVAFSDDTTAKIGISDFAQSELGDLVFINLPEVGDSFSLGDVLADVESVKAVSDIYSPVSGTVVAVNEELLDSPELVNEEAYEAWFVEMGDIEKTEELIDQGEYDAFVQSGGE